MKKIEWDDNLSVGIAAIDEQHRKWIEHYNKVVDAVESLGGPAPVNSTLSFLIDYTEAHFRTEQGFMAQVSYPGMAEHVVKHDELRDTVANLVRDFDEEGSTHQLGVAVETLLGNWLIDHIKEIDQQFGAYVREHALVLGAPTDAAR